MEFVGAFMCIVPEARQSSNTSFGSFNLVVAGLGFRV